MSTSNSSNNQNDYLENNINNEEEDSVDEEYIDPIDLSIIEDENWKPTEAQLNGYMNQLKFELDYKPEEVKKIAYDYLTKELPSGWRRAFFKVNHNVLYIEGETNEIHLVTDIEEKAKEEYDKLRAMKTSDLFYPQNLIQSHNNNIVKNDIHIDNNKEDIKKIDDLVKKKKDNYNKNDSDDYSFDIDDIPDYKKDEIDIDLLNINKNENNEDIDLNNLKKFYVDRAKSELRIYKEVLKKKYLKEKKEFYITLEELYEKKNILEKRKLQDNIINLNKELIERYEEDLFDKNEIELNEYEKKISNLMKEKAELESEKVELTESLFIATESLRKMKNFITEKYSNMEQNLFKETAKNEGLEKKYKNIIRQMKTNEKRLYKENQNLKNKINQRENEKELNYKSTFQNRSLFNNINNNNRSLMNNNSFSPNKFKTNNLLNQTNTNPNILSPLRLNNSLNFNMKKVNSPFSPYKNMNQNNISTQNSYNNINSNNRIMSPSRNIHLIYQRIEDPKEKGQKKTLEEFKKLLTKIDEKLDNPIIHDCEN
jgi:hypothetical protein